MAIDSAAFADAFQAYLDASDWEETWDIPKARTFITACTKLLAFPTLVGNNSVTTQFNRDAVEKALLRARQIVGPPAVNGAAGSVRQFSTEDFR